MISPNKRKELEIPLEQIKETEEDDIYSHREMIE